MLYFTKNIAWWRIMERMSNSERLDLIDLLLKYYNINIQDKLGRTVLMFASSYGYLNVVNRLLECKEIDINIQDTDGCTGPNQHDHGLHKAPFPDTEAKSRGVSEDTLIQRFL